jgi:3-beta hydroxysteroid dehydrogenase/isomerase family
VGRKAARLDNSYVHNLIHGFILAAEHLVPGGTAPGQAYFINDAEPVNMFEFARPVVAACGHRLPRLRISGAAVRAAMSGWQRLHFRFGLPKPPLEPLAIERLYLDNYFSVAKATRDLGYRPLFTTEQAMAECLPYYTELFDQMKAAAPPPSCTWTSGWLQSAGWREAAECAVTALSVVFLEPRCKGGRALGVGGEHLAVGPFGLQGAVEALYLAVLPRAVRFDEHLTGTEISADVADRVPVGPGVVGHDAFDAGDAVRAEVGCCPTEEGRAGGAFFVGQDFGVRQSGMVVDQ